MKIREEQGYGIIEMDPYISKDAVPMICQQLDAHLESGGKEFIIDMWEARTLNSSMASVIVHIIRHLSQGKCQLHIVNISPAVLNALESIHLADVVRVHETALDFEIETGKEISRLSH